MAREYALAGWTVKIADLDISQGTSLNWQSRRLQAGIEPIVPVERFGTVEQALKIGTHYDLLILDGPPHSTAGTLKIAAASCSPSFQLASPWTTLSRLSCLLTSCGSTA